MESDFEDDGSMEALDKRWRRAVKMYWQSPGQTAQPFIPEIKPAGIVGNPFGGNGKGDEEERKQADEFFNSKGF